MTNSSKLFHKVKQANLKYGLITNGDRVAVGLSGGKDSLVLLYALRLLQNFTPLEFNFVACTIDLGHGADYRPLVEYCAREDIPLVLEPTNIGRVVFVERREKSPCSLCANLRRGALNRVAMKHGCNKVALAHHLDDAVVTFLMSMAFEGQSRCFHPKTYLDRTGLTVIRPLVYVPEKNIISLCQQLSLPVVVNPCPASGKTKRQVIQDWLASLEKEHPRVKQHFLTAIEKSLWT